MSPKSSKRVRATLPGQSQLSWGRAPGNEETRAIIKGASLSTAKNLTGAGEESQSEHSRRLEDTREVL